MAKVFIVDARSSGIKGNLRLVATSNASVLIYGTLTGLTPGKHGFHVHTHGTAESDCNESGPHFDPHSTSDKQVKFIICVLN